MKKHKQKQSTVRIIGGSCRSRTLPVLDINGLRPTSDRMKETLFNWLQFDIVNSHCLDLFAGTGNLGIEALSRGALSVDFIELNKDAATQIALSVSNLSLQDKSMVHCKSAFDILIDASFSSKTGHPYDIIFIDPPFDFNCHQKIIDLLNLRLQEIDKLIIHDNTIIIIELPKDNGGLDFRGNFQLYKEYSTQYSKIQLLKIIK